MNYNLFYKIPVVWEMPILSRLHLNDLKSPKDITEAKFIKYFNDKTVVFNNQIITGLLLLRTHGCTGLYLGFFVWGGEGGGSRS